MDGNRHTHDHRTLLDYLEERIGERLREKRADVFIRRLKLLRAWNWDIEIVPKKRRAFYDRIAFAALFSFLASFSIARTIAYLVTYNHIPDIFLNVRGVHIHHFTYGIAVLAIVGFLSLLAFSPRSKIWLALGYGAGLGLAMDEAGQWLRLQDDYWVRQSYDAIIVSSIILLLVIYLPRYLQVFYKRFGVNGQEADPPKLSREDGSRT